MGPQFMSDSLISFSSMKNQVHPKKETGMMNGFRDKEKPRVFNHSKTQITSTTTKTIPSKSNTSVQFFNIKYNVHIDFSYMILLYVWVVCLFLFCWVFLLWKALNFVKALSSSIEKIMWLFFNSFCRGGVLCWPILHWCS